MIRHSLHLAQYPAFRLVLGQKAAPGPEDPTTDETKSFLLFIPKEKGVKYLHHHATFGIAVHR